MSTQPNITLMFARQAWLGVRHTIGEDKMKFNVEVDIDWIDEEEGLDQVIKDHILNSLTKSIEDRFTENAGEMIAKNAERLIQAKTEMIINTTLEKPLTINEGWSRKEEYTSIHDMIEQKMIALYEGKLNLHGTCKKDPLLANLETHVGNEISKLLRAVENKIKINSKEIADKALQENALIGALEKVIGDVE